MSEHTGNHARQTPASAVENPRNSPSTLSDRVRSLRLEEKPQQTRRSAWLPWLLCLMLAGATAYLGYAAYSRPASERTTTETERTAATTASAPVASSGEVVLESKGYIIPSHQIKVSPNVSGKVVQLLIEEGRHVQKGQVLARIEATDYQADVDHARSVVEASWQRFLELYTGNRDEEIHQARAEVEEAEAQKKQLYQDYKRNDRLKVGSVLAARDYEQAEGAFKAMDRRVERLRQAYHLMVEGPRKERVQAAWAEVLQSEADLAKSEWRLDNCIIRAPVTGTILTKKAEEGDIVNPVAFNISASVCEMADLSDLEVDLTIQERDISKVVKGQRCRIRLEAFPDRVYEGVVSRLMPIADRAKGAIPVRVKVAVPKNEEGYLKPEMGAVVSFLK